MQCKGGIAVSQDGYSLPGNAGRKPGGRLKAWPHKELFELLIELDPADRRAVRHSGESMLTIRQSQMKALSQGRRNAFEEDAVTHVRSLFPEDCGALSEEQVRARVRDGIERGRSYGLTGRDDLLIFVEHLFILGPEFDRIPEYSWARDLLMRSEYASPTKAELLAKLTLKHLRRAKFDYGR